MPKKRKLTAEDLYKFQFVADAQISPDGQTVLFTHTRFHPDKKKNTYQFFFLGIGSYLPFTMPLIPSS